MASRFWHIIAQGFRYSIAFLALLLLLGSLYRVASRSWQSEQLGPDQVELRVLHWGDKNEDAIVKELIDDFQRQNPDIRIVRTNTGSPPQLATKLQTMLSAGDPPDVFYLESERLADFAAKGLLANFDKLIAEDVQRGLTPANGDEFADLDDYFQPVVDAFRYNGHQVGLGPLFGLPKDFTPVGFYYNKDLFRQANVPFPPKDGWTWDEFISAAREIGKLPGCYGADFVTWEAIIRIYLFTWGTDFTSPGFEEFYFEDPAVQEAIETLAGWFHAEDRALLSAKTQLETGQEPFLAGNIGMAGPFGRWKVPTYRYIDRFEWDFAPLPHAKNCPPANGVLTVAWAMSAQSKSEKHREASWRLIKFLCGRRGQEMVCDMGLAVPVLKSVAETPCFSNPDIAPASDDVYLRSAEIASYIEWPTDPRYRDYLKTRLEEIFKLGRPVDEALAAAQADWESIAASTAFKKEYPKVPWGKITAGIGIPLAFIIAILATIWWKKRPERLAFSEEIAGLTMISPWVIGFCVFTAFPIVLSLLLAFTRWSGLSTLDQAEWVGWDNFRQLLTYDATFRQALWVTSLYALLAVPTGQIAALLAAMLLNREIRGIGVYRAIWYLPSVLAGVGMAIMWKWVLHHEHGLLNMLLEPILGLFGAEPPRWFEKDAPTWAVPAFALINLWVIGGTMMIYLAGLKGIPKDLYEAAEIDGATGPRQFTNVTLPMLSPIIFFNVIIAIIASFQIFTQVFIMTGGGPGTSTHFYVFYIYKRAFDLHNMGYASAMAWLLLVIVLVLTLIVMRGSRRFVYYEALKA